MLQAKLYKCWSCNNLLYNYVYYIILLCNIIFSHLVAHKVFFSPKNVADIIDEFQKFNSKEGNWKERRDLTNEQKKEIDKFLKNLKVSYEIPGQKNLKRTYRVNQIGPSADEHTFQHNGNSITIAKYFQNHKQYKLKHPYLPCLWVGAKERVDKIYLPAEVRKPTLHLLEIIK